jgi:hypothetical protein
MAEDLELNALFELSQPFTRMPQTDELTRLDTFFESSDYQLDPVALDKEAGLQEIRIESGAVVRQYQTTNADGDEITTLIKSCKRGSKVLV